MSHLYQQYLQNPDVLLSLSEEFLASKVSDFPLDSGYKTLLALKKGGSAMHSLTMHCKDRLLRMPAAAIPPSETVAVFDAPVYPIEDLSFMEENNQSYVPVQSDMEESGHAPQSVDQNASIPEAEAEKSIHQETEGSVVKHGQVKKKKKKDKFRLREYAGISPFSLWLLSFQEDDLEKKLRKEAKAAKKRALEESARKSVTPTVEIVSEPLADILASQGHLDAAKKMYAQLMQKYPEKSSYFASKIEQILKNT